MSTRHGPVQPGEGRPGEGAWARLLATSVVRDEGSPLAERGRTLLRDGDVGPLDIELGRVAARVGTCTASLTARPVPQRIWTAMVRSARGNRPLEEAVEGRAQSVHLEHLMSVDWSEPLVPRAHDLGRRCSCDGADLCEHVAALGYAVARAIDDDPSVLLRWRGCVAEPGSEPDDPVEAVSPEPAADPWTGGVLPEPAPLRPLPVGAVLKRLGPSGLEIRGDDLATVLERAYAAFATSDETKSR